MANNIISSLGAGSGIDITSLVTQLTEVERASPQERIDTTKKTLQAQISGYGKLTSALDAIKTSVSTLATNDLFKARSVAVPTSDAITADKVSPGAQAGIYQIKVNDVASAQSLAMASSSDRGAALGKAGDMTIRFGSWAYTDAANPDDPDVPTTFTANDARASLKISVDASDSLDTLAAKINGQKSGVQASVLKVNGNYQLMLTSPSGKSNALEVNVTNSTPDDPASLLDDFSFNATSTGTVNETQQAKNAELTVNGLKVFRESNSIDDVIEGFAFTLNKAAPTETLTFSVTEDKSTAEQAVRDFVTAYNTFQKSAQELVGYSRDADNKLVRGDLAGDSTARTMISRMRELIGGAVPGVQSGFTALTNVGIRTELDGTLKISETEFSDAISSNFDLFENLFASKSSATNSAVSVNMGSYASKAVAGSYKAQITQDPTKGQSVGGAVTHDFASPLDTSGGDYSFKVGVDGAKSETIKLNGNYTSVEALRTDLQSLINGDVNLKKANVALDVSFDTDTNSFTFVSREYGSASKVSFSDFGDSDKAAELGLSASMTNSTGVDVAGTIDGVAGFGAGNVLLPSLGSKVYGLNLTVGSGASANGEFEINFSRGFAGELSKLITDFEGTSGAIKMRQDSIQSQLDGLDETQTALNTRMDKFSARLLAQFTAMESIVDSLQSTGDQLTGLSDRLPFTSSNN